LKNCFRIILTLRTMTRFIQRNRFPIIWSLSLVVITFISALSGYGALYVFGVLFPLIQTSLLAYKFKSARATFWLVHIFIYFSCAELNWMTEKDLWYGIPALIILNMLFGQLLIRVISKTWNRCRWTLFSSLGGLFIFSVMFPFLELNLRLANEAFDTAVIVLVWFFGYWIMSWGLTISD